MIDKINEWFDNQSETIVNIILVLLLAMVVGIILLLTLSPWIAPVQCHNTWKDSGYESRYTSAAGCQIKAEKGWVPADKFRITK